MGDPAKDRIGEYEILAPLGQGSRGRVFKARCVAANHPRVTQGREVALKVLHLPGLDARDAELFRERAEILCELDHPNIVRTLDVFVWRPGEWDEVRCVVSEYVEGETLEARLRQKPNGLDWPEAQALFRQVLAGLAHARSRNVQHRDLKPSNILLASDGTAKVFDFDVARKDENGQASTAAWKGSFDYMAPDFVVEPDFRGDEISDVFSLGVCFFEALTGKLPFEPLGKGAHVAYLTRWHGGGKPPEIAFRAGIFRVLAGGRRFVERAVQPARAQRFASFAQMAAELETLRYRRIRHDDKEEYELQAVLGRGGFGEVFLARRVRDGLKVAVKHLFAQKQSERFIREARILQRCRHAQICRHIDFFTVKTATEEHFYLVMEYLEGMPGWSLRSRIKTEGALPVAEVVPLFVNYLKALQFLHEGKRPIIHRDLKPTNLYAPVGRPEKGCIFDLGVARDVTGTVTYGGIPGTLDYMAPEFGQAGTDRGSPRSDLYALGLCLYESVCGKPAFEKLPTDLNTAWTEFQKRCERAQPLRFDAPVFREYPGLAAVIRRATEFDPARRTASAREMIRELEAALGVGAEEDEPTLATRPTQLPEELPVLPAPDPTPEPPDPVEAVSADGSAEGLEAPPPPRRATAVPVPSTPPEPVEDGPVTMATRMDDGEGAAAAWVAGQQGRQRRKKILLRSAIAAAAVVLAVLGVQLLRGSSARALVEEAGRLVGTVADPQPTAAYVAQAGDCLKQLDGFAQRQPQFESDWRVFRIAVQERVRRVPDLIKERFAVAAVDRDAGQAGALLDEWLHLREHLGLLDLTTEQFEERADYMKRMAARLRFESAAAEAVKQVPARIEDTAALRQAEAAAGAYRTLRTGAWEGMSPGERQQQLGPLGSALTNAALAYLTRLAASAAQGDAELAELLALTDGAPALVELVRPAYDGAVLRVDAARQAARSGPVARQLLTEVEAASTPADLTTLAARLTAWEKDHAGSSPELAGQLLNAFTARYRAQVAALVDQARAAYAATNLAAGDEHARRAQEARTLVPERFGRAQLVSLTELLVGARAAAVEGQEKAAARAQELALSQQRAAAEMEQAGREQNRKQALADATRNLGEARQQLAKLPGPASWRTAFQALQGCDAIVLADAGVKQAWQKTAADLAAALDAGLLQKEPLAERTARVEAVGELLASPAAAVIFGGPVAGLRERLALQRSRFILRLANGAPQALTVVAGDAIRRTVLPAGQRLDFTIPGSAASTAVTLEVSAGEGWLPRSNVVDVVGGRALELVLQPLEKAAVAPVPAVANSAGGVLRISISPKAARVWVDDQEVQPGDVAVSSGENHTVRAEAPGCVTYEQSYRVQPGKTRAIDILLERKKR